MEVRLVENNVILQLVNDKLRIKHSLSLDVL